MILIKKPIDCKNSEITPESVYENRRHFLKAAGLMTASATIPTLTRANTDAKSLFPNASYTVDDDLTSEEDVISYNNFYEFGTRKSDPAKNAHTLKPRPWTITIEGEAENTGKFQLEDFIKPYELEDRIYRHRCVEAWSMVVPWQGFELSRLIKACKPTSKAKYLSFETLHDPKQMPGQQRRVLHWPYSEGLRMDEAMHPLTLMTTGVYGKTLPNQNGAPLRLIIPWKYGFKGIKSIVKIRFQEKQPNNSWKRNAPSEYGFYANVNPDVDHPRWSQASERKIGAGFSIFNPRQKTLFLNGYADQVASLYSGMDLSKNY